MLPRWYGIVLHCNYWERERQSQVNQLREEVRGWAILLAFSSVRQSGNEFHNLILEGKNEW